MTMGKKPMQVTSKLIRAIGNIIGYLSKENRLCIITYHRILDKVDPLLEPEVDIETFTWQMETLAKNFNVMSLNDAITALREGRVPPRAVCITFDDGYRSCHDFALPILNHLDLSATVFVTSGFLDNGNMWNDRIIEAIRNIHISELDLREVGLGVYKLTSIDCKKKAVKEINDICKYFSMESRARVIELLEKFSEKNLTSNLMLTRKMVLDLALNGFEIGGHTVTHPILSKANDEVAHYEIKENKRVLEEIIGKPLKFFAYPNGKAKTDFDHRHVKMVRDLGYSAAFTTRFGAATKANDFLEMPRARPWDSTPLLFSLRLLYWLTRDSSRINSDSVTQITPL